MFEINPPNFCSKCGNTIGESRASNIQTKDNIRTQNIEIDDPSGEDVFTVPNISSLEYTIEGGYENEPISFGRLMEQESEKAKDGQSLQPIPKRKPVREKPRTREDKTKKQDIISQSIQECASSRRPQEELSDEN